MEWNIVAGGKKKSEPSTNGFTIVAGGRKQSVQPAAAPLLQEPQIAEQPQAPGFLSQLGGSLGGLATSLVAGAAKIPANAFDLAMALGQGQPQVSDTGEITNPRLSPEQRSSLALGPKVESAAESVREKLPQPLGFTGEKFVNKIAEALPAFFGAGGGFKNAIARAIGSESGRELVKGTGAGELAQFFGSVAGAGLASGLLTNNNLKKLESLNYNDFEKSIPENAKTSLSNASKAYDEALKSKALLPGASKWLKDNLGEVETVLKSGKAGTEEAYKDMKYLNRIIREEVPAITSKGVRDEVKKALQSISTGIKEDIVSSVKDNPGLNAQALIDGSSISYARNNAALVKRLLKMTGISPSTAGVAGAGGLGTLAVKGLLGKVGAPLAAGATVTKAFAEPAMMAYQSPAVRQELLGKTIPQTLAGILGSR